MSVQQSLYPSRLRKGIFGFLVKLSVGLSALPMTLLASPSEAAIIKEMNFESGDFNNVARQFQEKRCSDSQAYIDGSLFKITQKVAREGRNSVRHHLQNCDERSELAVPGLKVNQEYWSGWSYLFPKDFFKPNPGQTKGLHTVIQQMGYKDAWREQTSGKMLVECNKKYTQNGIEKTGGAPGNHLTIKPIGEQYQYKYSLKSYQGKDELGRAIFGCQHFTIPAQLDQWEDFVINFKYADDPDEGFFKLWKNGQLYIDEKMAMTRPGVDLLDHWKIGGYVGDPGNVRSTSN